MIKVGFDLNNEYNETKNWLYEHCSGAFRMVDEHRKGGAGSMFIEFENEQEALMFKLTMCNF